MTPSSRDDLASRIAGLSPAKRALLELKLTRKQSEGAVGAVGSASIPRRLGRQSAELSFAQQRLWFLDQLEPNSSLYNMPRQIKITGSLDIPSLQRALDSVVARHESLRTTFPAEHGHPRQVIEAAAPLVVPFIDLSDRPTGERELEAQRVATSVRGAPFDLEHGPLVRAVLVRLQAEEHLLVVALHHIITDGWSMGVLFRDLGVFYQAYSAGTVPSLPELPIQYADYAEWQREWLQGSVLARQLGYWRDRLSSLPDPVRLPSDQRGRRQSREGTSLPILVPAHLGRRLHELSQREGATLFMTLLAAFKTLLWRYSGQEDLVVGTPIAGRTHTELEGLIGFFVNTLVMRTDLSGDPTFVQLLSRVRDVALGAYANQDLPFERVVEEVQPERDLSRNPLFQIVFGLHNAPRSAVELPGLVLTLVSSEPVTSKFDLALVLTERGDEVRGVLSYSTELFDAAAIERMVTHFMTLLEGIAAHPDTRISELPLLPATERHRVVVAWNATRVEQRPARGVHQLFEEQAERTPDAVAIVASDRELTYRELDRRANQLARLLRKLGVRPETRVGLIAEPSPKALIGVLGILKAGGTYVALDPNYPPAQLAFMLEDSGATLLLAQSEGLATDLLEGLGRGVREIVPLGDSDSGGDESAEEPASQQIDGGSLAYVMYTSGSSGTPKGVGVPHRAVAAFSLAAAAEYGLTPGDRVLQLASMSSDLSVDEIFPAWASGAAVVLPAERPGPGDDLVKALERDRVTVVSLPTAFWHAWVQELTATKQAMAASLRLVIVGGEKAQPAAYAAWLDLDGTPARWLNTYGPTETTVEATLYEPGAATGSDRATAELPIGRPLANTRTYVLDRHLNPVPIGVPGELCIGGAGVARGYLGRPGLTATKFIPDEFGGEPGARLYRTGDLVRQSADGNLEFLGRLDRQVKIRGYRVEPGEVEAAVLRHPAVRECAVIAREDTPGDRRLVSYLVPVVDQSPPSLGDLQEFLGGRVPVHMIPTALVLLESLPLTPNGKIDRRALPPPDGQRPELPREFRAPRTSVEETITTIWRQVLKVDRVGLDDNFFALGGHSLLATQVVARVRAAFGIQLPLRTLFEAPTVAGLAEGLHTTQRLLEEVASLTPAAVSAQLEGNPRAHE